MWMFKFVPDFVYYVIFISGLLGLLLLPLLPKIQFKQPLKILCYTLVAVGIYTLGMLNANNWWVRKAESMVVKVEAAEVASESVNQAIKEKIIIKREYYKQKGQDIIQYIDREVVKQDANCKVGDDFVTAHNRAAQR